MKSENKTELREMKDGRWYWIDKAVIQRYAREIGAMGVAVYNFLASLADSDQSCFPSQKHIACSLGYSRATVNRTLKLLEEKGLIRKEREGNRCFYLLLKVRCKADETHMSKRRNLDVARVNTNNNKLTRNNNNIVIENILTSKTGPFKGFKPKNREELLAQDLAEELNDTRNLFLYLSHAKRYPESVLRRILGEVKEIPPERIKKGRAALFNYLLKRYVQEASEDLRD
jgi:DNA-binding MarR family transcriptional regulator